jgi:hypothetical protein
MNATVRRGAERKLLGTCPICSHANLDATARPDGRGWYVGCWSCEAAGLTGADYLAELAEAVGCRPYQLIEDAPTFLAACLNGEMTAARVPAPLPSEGTIAGWASRLLSSGRATAWLRRRGISEETMGRFELGFDGAAIAIPVRDDAGELVNLRRRFLAHDADPKIRGLVGRGTQLYPIGALAGRPRFLVVCEGELDALLLDQLGLAAITGTGGAGHWKPEWTEYVAARARGVVAIVLDADATTTARRRAAELRAAGVDARAVDLSRLGYGPKTDVGDLLAKHGWTELDLRTFLTRSRRERPS